MPKRQPQFGKIQMSPALRRAGKAERIRAAWAAREAVEPDISTERLIAMVCDDTGADWDEVVAAVTPQSA